MDAKRQNVDPQVSSNGFVTNPYLAHMPARMQVVDPLEGWIPRKVTGKQITKAIVRAFETSRGGFNQDG